MTKTEEGWIATHGVESGHRQQHAGSHVSAREGWVEQDIQGLQTLPIRHRHRNQASQVSLHRVAMPCNLPEVLELQQATNIRPGAAMIHEQRSRLDPGLLSRYHPIRTKDTGRHAASRLPTV